MIQFLVNNVMMPLLNFFYLVSNNYAVAIILLTIAVKVAFYPLNKKQFVSMRRMNQVQPKIKELQKKYQNEPQKMQTEMMKIYKEENINPLSGCLPILIQLPIFFALFATLNSDSFQKLTSEVGANAHFFWITSLSEPDPYKILPIIIGISTWLSQKTMTTDPQQAKMFAFLPILMVLMSWGFPSGVLLYWAFSTIISTVQQVYMNRKYGLENAGSRK